MLTADRHACTPEPQSCFRGLPHTLFAYDFSYNKRRLLKQFAAESTLRFVRDGAAVEPGSTLLLWGSTAPPRGLTGSVNVIRVEDGFLRSVGLGAELVRPLSWVFDFQGIYYDANRPSLLETWLNTADFDEALLLRAARFRAQIVASGLTKYNVLGEVWTRPVTTRRVILVVGQVEGDASLAHGAGEIRRNIDLLRAVRQQYPQHYLVYKPHPDLVAHLRRGGIARRVAEDLCDEVVANATMSTLLAQVDQVHVMTSLAGFEALLREKRVVCHGRPFYAGWGLTDDRVAIPRRARARSLDELVAAALLMYPTYVSARSGQKTTAEGALQDLIEWRANAEQAGRYSVSRAARRCLFMLYARLPRR